MKSNEQLGMQIRKGLNWVRQGPPQSSDYWALGEGIFGFFPHVGSSSRTTNECFYFISDNFGCKVGSLHWPWGESRVNFRRCVIAYSYEVMFYAVGMFTENHMCWLIR